MPRIVALDIARIGAAAWRDGDCIVTRAFVLSSRTDKREESSSRLLEWLGSLFAESRPEVVSVEDDTGRGGGSRTLRGYQTVAMVCANRLGASYRVDIDASRARKLALVNGGGSKAEAVAKARMLYRIGSELMDDEVNAVIILLTTEQLIKADTMLAAARHKARLIAAPQARRRAGLESE